MKYYLPEIRDTETTLQVLKEAIKEEVLAELIMQQKHALSSALHRSPRINLENDAFDIGVPIGTNDLTWPDNPQTGASIANWVDNLSAGQNKNILYGVGTAALLGMLMPSFRQKVQAIVTRTATEGIELIEKARALVHRAKEDIEDLVAEASLGSSARQNKG